MMEMRKNGNPIQIWPLAVKYLPMNILVFSWRDPKHPLAGGAEQVMHEHMKGWGNGGHNVTLFASRFTGSLQEEVLDGVRIVREGNQYLGVQFKGFLYYRRHKNNFDLVVDQFHGLPFFTPLYVRKPKIAVIQETAREVWFLNHLVWPLNLIVGSLGFLVEPLIFLLYKNITFVTGSESAKNDLAYFGILKKNITVIPHGVIVEKLEKIPPKEKKFTIVYLGVLSKDKGIEDAIKTFDILKDIDSFQFWVIGKAQTVEYEKKIKGLVGEFGLEKNVTFWGFVSQKQKFELLAKAHVLINPSFREGWGLVNIEANAMGVPVVAYSSPGLVDSVKDGESGILCKNNTPEELAKNIALISGDHSLYNKLQKRAKKWNSNFSWEDSANKSLRLIEKVTT